MITDAIVFLDIDGVLIPYDLTAHGSSRAVFSGSAISALNRITDQTGAKIIISSTWRYYHNLDALRRILAQEGVTGEIVDALHTDYPADQAPSSRGEEINHWLLEKHYKGPFVILDDDTAIDPLNERHVHIMSSKCLSHSDAEMAISMLKTGLLPEGV
jgi:DNA-binding LacI/PurR family transcriptional regulator